MTLIMETLIKDVAGLISTLLHRVDIQALCCTCKHNREMLTFEDIRSASSFH